MSIEAMKQALEGKSLYEITGSITDIDKCIIHRFDLIQAIAEAEKQEPVIGVEVKRVESGGFTGNVWWIHENLQEGVFHLYTHPQPKREWVGLTDEDDIDWDGTGNLKQLVEAVEAKLKEKNT